MKLPKLQKSNERLYRTQKSHYRTTYKAFHISVINAPDDLPSCPWMYIVWRAAREDPDNRGPVAHTMRHFKLRKHALSTAIHRIERAIEKMERVT